MLRKFFAVVALTWVAGCAAEPRVIRHEPFADAQRVIVLDTNMEFCRSSLDCGFGEFCKDRGDGVRVCMGNGSRNAYCRSSIDCGSGLFCRDRGDGLRVCR